MIDTPIRVLRMKSDPAPARRGPMRLFDGTPTPPAAPVRKEADPFDGLPAAVVKVAKARGYGIEGAKLMALVSDHFARTGEPLTLDTFEIAAAIGTTTARVDAIREGFLRSDTLRRRHTSGSLSIEGLAPGDWG